MIGKILFLIKSIRFIPALLIVNLPAYQDLITYERDRWIAYNHINEKGEWGFITLMMKFPEYRSLVYHRTGCRWLRHFAKGQTNLYFHTPSHKIGKGLVIWHGYSTVINAESIGEDCSIWHNATIGKKTILPICDKPVIGNNVSICTGAIVLGNIKIENNCTIGAGSVVVDDVLSEGATVIGNKAKIFIK